MDIRFPNLGIEIAHLGQSITVGGFEIAYYGIIIAIGMMCGYFMAIWQAKRTGQDTEMYLDVTMWAVVFAILGARMYFVLFNLSYYMQNPSQILNIRGGGLAIYGGIIGGVITVFVFSRIKKVSFLQMLDTMCVGLVTGQIIGRWGNFCNREAFGDYTDGLFAMQIPKSDVRMEDVTTLMLDHLKVIDGIEYIQVHPTFLYESLWNILVLLVLLLMTTRKKYQGQVFTIYMLGYGLGRFWVERLRTDQLLLPHSQIPVSMLLSGVLVVVSVLILLIQKIRKVESCPKFEKKESDSSK